MAKTTKSSDGIQPSNALVVERTPNETGAQATARKLLEPSLRNALAASAFAGRLLGKDVEHPGLMDFVGHVESLAAKAEAGELAFASRTLAAHAITLDSMFTEFARRAALNMGEYMDTAERYARLSLKAQTNCRATIDALAKLHQPREQTVRHVHVNEGGQAVVADHFHHHPGGNAIGKSVKQSHAAGAAGASAALPGPNPQGGGVPIPSGKRKAAMSHARGHQSGRTKGQ